MCRQPLQRTLGPTGCVSSPVRCPSPTTAHVPACQPRSAPHWAGLFHRRQLPPLAEKVVACPAFGAPLAACALPLGFDASTWAGRDRSEALVMAARSATGAA